MWRCGVLCMAGVVSAGLSVSSPARAELVVTISKADQRMSVAVDGSEMYRWPVSTGRGRYATPSGQWRPVRFERSWYSRKYDNAPMPFSIFFYRGYAVHGTTEVRHLGRAASAWLREAASRQRGDAVLAGAGAGHSGYPHRRHQPAAERIADARDRATAASSPLSRPRPFAERAGSHGAHDRHAGFDAFGKAAAKDDGKTPAATTVETVSAKAVTPLPPVKVAAVDETAPHKAMPDKAAVAAPVAKLHVEPTVARAANSVVRGDRLPAEALRPGTHVVTMKVGSQAELRDLS